MFEEPTNVIKEQIEHFKQGINNYGTMTMIQTITDALAVELNVMKMS